MNLFRSIRAVFLFELRRSLTLSRIGFWLLLATFPPLLIGLMRYNQHGEMDERVWTLVLYGLIPEFTCLAGLWFWMSPSIQTELENRTWIYMAVRPAGRRAVLLGKYLTALVWTITAGWVALVVALPIAHVKLGADEERPKLAGVQMPFAREHDASADLAPQAVGPGSATPESATLESAMNGSATSESLGAQEDGADAQDEERGAWATQLELLPIEFWRGLLVLGGLVVLSCIGRGAAFALISVIAPHRAMVLSFAYALIFEFIVGMIPALINQLTVQLRLRSLLIHWMNWGSELPPGISLFFDPAPAYRHVLLLFLFSGIALTAAIVTLEHRQFPTSEEG